MGPKMTPNATMTAIAVSPAPHKGMLFQLNITLPFDACDP